MSDELEQLRAKNEELLWQRNDIQQSLENRLEVVNRLRREKADLQARANTVIALCHKAITANAEAELSGDTQRSVLLPDYVLRLLTDEKWVTTTS